MMRPRRGCEETGGAGLNQKPGFFLFRNANHLFFKTASGSVIHRAALRPRGFSPWHLPTPHVPTSILSGYLLPARRSPARQMYKLGKRNAYYSALFILCRWADGNRQTTTWHRHLYCFGARHRDTGGVDYL